MSRTTADAEVGREPSVTPCSSLSRISHRPTMTARKLSALTAKVGPTPKAPMASPAAAGPTTREPLTIAELIATAFPMSSRPTSSMTNAWRTGMSTALATPSRKARPRIIHNSTRPVMTRTARIDARTIIVVCVQIRTRRLGSASAATPANRPRKMTGPYWATAVIPSQSGSCVIWRTSQACATCCIHVPMRDTV